ncbi:MAG TPA: hypothetical protein VLV76_02200 [Candidatus Acidoferrum sp.]|nr:hypothetical protein [Candidatus Acidoferrum sp.]
MSTETTATTGPEGDPPPMPVEVIFSDGSLVLVASDGSALEVPLTRHDAVQLIAALAEYAYPGCRLRSTPAAGIA